jgi:hypothetical protein
VQSTNAWINTNFGIETDGGMPRPFTVECVLPGQITGRCQPRSGEERLMLAVLEDAINCFFGDDRKARMEATVWLKERECASPFGFENICSVLGLDSSWLRKGLFRQRAGRGEAADNPGLMRFSRAA